MPLFRYRAKDIQGRMVEGRVEAPTLVLAETALKDRGYEVVLLKELKRKFSLPSFEWVRTRDLVIFARQLSVLVGANVPIVQSLRTTVKQTPSPVLNKILQQVADEVEAGARLSLAFAKHPKIFDEFFVNMIKAGETAGRLNEVLGYLADQKEKDYDLNSKIRGAMMYPGFIIFGMVVVGIIMLVYIIPQLTSTLQEAGVELPWTTRLLIGTSRAVKEYGWFMLGGLVALVVGLRYALRNADFREVWDKGKLRLPVVGTLFQRIYLARFSRSLNTLLAGGVDIVSSLKGVGKVIGNAHYERLVRQTVREVEDGNSIITVFKDSPLVPAMLSQMLSVGEETGQLSSILERLTAFYTREVDNSVTNLISVIEPLLMIVIGVGVGMIVASIILPMYRLAGQF